MYYIKLHELYFHMTVSIVGLLTLTQSQIHNLYVYDNFMKVTTSQGNKKLSDIL
jgi:hypothetical protein